MIRAKRLRQGDGLPPERQLAIEFDVSRGVVRAAIRNLSSMGLIESKRNCRPVVRNAISGRHIGIWLWPNPSDYGSASILKGIQEANLGEGVRLIVASAPPGDWDSTFEAERRFLESLADEPVEAGAIAWYLGGDRNLPALERLRDSQVPIVFVDRQPPIGFAADYVATNNENASLAAVRHLIDLGHRRIGLISNIDRASSVAEREIGYERALRMAGIPRDPDLIKRDSVDEPIGIEGIVDGMFALANPPTAIFCINDHIALQAYDILERRHIRIPQDISLVGFDGSLRWVPGGGYLTSVEQDFYRMGRLAAELVIERMTNGRPQAYKHVLLDAPLADHGSTAYPTVLQRRTP